MIPSQTIQAKHLKAGHVAVIDGSICEILSIDHPTGLFQFVVFNAAGKQEICFKDEWISIIDEKHLTGLHKDKMGVFHEN